MCPSVGAGSCVVLSHSTQAKGVSPDPRQGTVELGIGRPRPAAFLPPRRLASSWRRASAAAAYPVERDVCVLGGERAQDLWNGRMAAARCCRRHETSHLSPHTHIPASSSVCERAGPRTHNAGSRQQQQHAYASRDAAATAAVGMAAAWAAFGSEVCTLPKPSVPPFFQPAFHPLSC